MNRSSSDITIINIVKNTNPNSNEIVNFMFHSLIDKENHSNEFLMPHNKCRTCKKLKKMKDFTLIKKINNGNNAMRYLIHNQCFDCYHKKKESKNKL